MHGMKAQHQMFRRVESHILGVFRKSRFLAGLLRFNAISKCGPHECLSRRKTTLFAWGWKTESRTFVTRFADTSKPPEEVPSREPHDHSFSENLAPSPACSAGKVPP